jgi:predicted deacetylase
MIRFHVSVHDVMPETLDHVERIVDELDAAGHAPATLLVVPGRNWTDSDLERLRRYAHRGHPLAGHGWTHTVPAIRNLYHLAHSLLISRRAAEHLALDRLGIEALVSRCRRWFERHDLPAPDLYVPPAWALGPVSARQLQGTGFRYIETLSGLHDTRSGRIRRLPLLGFEADTRIRAVLLRRFNAVNRWLAETRTGAARLAIHPRDPGLCLGDDLRGLIRDARDTVKLDELMAPLVA